MQIGSVQSSPLNLGGQASKVSKASAFAYYDPKDTNQDGIVSVTEEMAYALKHPEVELMKRLREGPSAGTRGAIESPLSWYTAKSSTISSGGSGFLDLYA